MATKTYPQIKSRILSGFTYPASYPRGLKGYVDSPALANSALPAAMLNVPLTLENLARKTIPSMKGAYYLGTLPKVPQTGDDSGYYANAGPVAGVSASPVRWIIRKVSGGYSIELEKPIPGGKYLAAPDVCFTPLVNPDAALKDEQWPIGKIVNGKVVPHKYAVQGPEWSPSVGGIKNPKATQTFNGMFATPGWWPVVKLSTAQSQYTVWKINLSTAYYNSKGMGGGPYLSFQPANARPVRCPSILKFFPPNSDEYYKVATFGNDMGTALTAWAVGLPKTTAAPKTRAPGTLAPGETSEPVATDTPFEMSAAPAYGVNTRVSAGNTDIGLDISNASSNTNNIANQGGGDGGGGGGDATTSLLLASLLAQQQQQQPAEAPPAVYPYPNPYAVPPPLDPGLTATPEPLATTLSPAEIALQALLATQTPAPAAAWYSSPLAIGGGIVALVAVMFAVWWFVFRKKKASNSATADASVANQSGGYYSLPANSRANATALNNARNAAATAYAANANIARPR